MSFANTALDNISQTTASADLNPAVDDGYAVGTPTKRWKDGYVSQHLAVGPVTTPQAPLHVIKTAASGGTPNSNSMVVFERSNTGYLQLITPNANENGILFGLASNTADGCIVYNNVATPHGLQLRTGGNSTKAVLTQDGYLGLGTTAPQGLLHLIGNAEEITNTATVTTTTATAATMVVASTASNKGYYIEADVVARQTNGTNETNIYKIAARVKNNAGILSFAATQLLASEEVAAWDATVTTSGTNIAVQVTGAASTNITWKIIARIRTV